jgi:hypothetical protein
MKPCAEPVFLDHMLILCLSLIDNMSNICFNHVLIILYIQNIFSPCGNHMLYHIFKTFVDGKLKNFVLQFNMKIETCCTYFKIESKWRIATITEDFLHHHTLIYVYFLCQIHGLYLFDDLRLTWILGVIHWSTHWTVPIKKWFRQKFECCKYMYL